MTGEITDTTVNKLPRTRRRGTNRIMSADGTRVLWESKD
jgi:hypothetical protein